MRKIKPNPEFGLWPIIIHELDLPAAFEIARFNALRQQDSRMQVRKQSVSHPIAHLDPPKRDLYCLLSQELIKKAEASPLSTHFVSSRRGIHDRPLGNVFESTGGQDYRSPYKGQEALVLGVGNSCKSWGSSISRKPISSLKPF